MTPPLPNQSVVELLQTVALFESLEPSELHELAEVARITNLVEGDRLFAEGENAGDIMFVVSGSIRLTCRDLAGVEIVVGYVQAGDILGEMAVIDPDFRSASAWAVEPTVVLWLSAEAFGVFMDRGHPVARVMLVAIRQMMSHRIRVLNERIGALFLIDAEETVGVEFQSMVVRLRDIWAAVRSGG